VLVDGRIVNAGVVQDPNHVFNVVSKPGEVLGAFGAGVKGLSRLGRPAPAATGVAYGGGIHLWIGGGTEYEVVQWTVDGDVVRRIRRNPSWFRDAVSRANDSIPRPLARPSVVDSTGLLLVGIQVWRPDAAKSVVTQRRVELPRWSNQYGLIFEVIDTRSGRLMASRAIDPAAFSSPPTRIARTNLLADRSRERTDT
jgi:hypothetical protein